MARRASITLSVSTCPPRATRPGRLIPAVSTMRNCLRCHVNMASTESLVVPGTSETIIRSSLSSRFTSDDLPAFGRPTIATAVSRRSSSEVTRGASGKRRNDGVHQFAHARAVLGADLDDGSKPSR